jgi:hypothetical protein
MIRGLLQTIRESIGARAAGDGANNDENAEKLKNSTETRHALIENFVGRRGRILSMIPFIVVLSVASTNLIAAVWAAFGVSAFLNLLDLYRSRYNPKVSFPMIVNFSFLLSYMVCVILAYVLTPPLSPNYVGPIVVTGVFSGMLLSLIFQYPFTIQISGPEVDETTRKSLGFFRLNQVITLFWIVLMGITMIFIWCSTLFAPNTAGQIILGIVFPIILPIGGQIATPYLAEYLKAYGNKQKKEEDTKDDETSNLLEKQ